MEGGTPAPPRPESRPHPKDGGRSSSSASPPHDDETGASSSIPIGRFGCLALSQPMDGWNAESGPSASQARPTLGLTGSRSKDSSTPLQPRLCSFGQLLEAGSAWEGPGCPVELLVAGLGDGAPGAAPGPAGGIPWASFLPANLALLPRFSPGLGPPGRESPRAGDRTRGPSCRGAVVPTPRRRP
jgi:hypothetical protein